MIVITGASDGLGLQIAKVYHEAGKRVINLSRTNSKYADENIQTDLTDDESVAASVRKVLALDEPLEVLINCAGVMSVQPLGSITAEEVNKTFGVNIEGAILLVSGLVERIKTDRTDIVNVASTVGTKAYPSQSAYGATKWAMRGFSRNLQVELKATNRVISFCVGGFNSDIAKKATDQNPTDPENWMRPEDIAVFVKQMLDLPKNMEVSEIILNRRPLK